VSVSFTLQKQDLNARWTASALSGMERLALAERLRRPGAEALVSLLRFPSAHLPGRSPAMTALYGEMALLARGEIPVLILGETGVGKEHVARTLHLSSSRSRGPFVGVNCAAIPADLLEAELFGIRKGVATGVAHRKGIFEQAREGTLFLDEIGDMLPALQAKVLRTLQEKQIRPVGGRPSPVDVRVISATNSDLGKRIEAGTFRQDLYYRLAGCELRIPPLRHRREDIPALVEHFMRATAAEIGKRTHGITDETLRALQEYPWPGNVRQLEHEIRRLVYLCPPCQPIDASLLSPQIAAGRCPAISPAPSPASLTAREPATPRPDGETLNLAALEKRAILQALHQSRGILVQAAELLGISRDALRRRMRRHGVAAVPAGGDPTSDLRHRRAPC